MYFQMPSAKFYHDGAQLVRVVHYFGLLQYLQSGSLFSIAFVSYFSLDLERRYKTENERIEEARSVDMPLSFQIT